MAMAGTVKFFNAERGYGFIKPDDGGRDVFVHITAVERAGLKALTEGQRLSFEVEPDKEGQGSKGGQPRRHGLMPERRFGRAQKRTLRPPRKRLA
jgi:CspA family cold shock protein